MAKKKSRASQTSKGEIGVNKKLRNAYRREYKGTLAQAINQHTAWKKFKNVVLTVPNPNKNETAKPFIRVNARDYWGSPKRTSGVLSKSTTP